MSELRARITEDVKAAMKAQAKLALTTLRMLTAEIKQREVVESTEITDAVVISAIEKMIKQRRDSVEQYRAGNRPELAEQESAEIALLAAYLPQALSESEITALIEAAVAQTGAAGIKDMGRVMAWIKPQAAGRADMGQISAKIKARLG